MLHHFGDKSFQSINCTGTDNRKQRNKVTHAPKHKSRALPNKLHNPGLVTFYNIQRRNEAGLMPILTIPEHARDTDTQD